MKVVRYQLPEIVEALSSLQTFAVEKKDSETMFIAKSIQNEIMTWCFVLCVVIWYNVLYQINHVSKILQSPSVSLETLKKETQGVQTYLNDFRESGLYACQTDVREIAEALDIEMMLPEKRQQKTSRQFLYEGRDQTQSTPEESFTRKFFLPLFYTAIGSLND